MTPCPPRHHTTVRRLAGLLGIVVLAATGLTGCLHARTPPAVEISMIGPAQFLVDGRLTDLPGLPARLRAAGAEPGTPVRVQVSTHTTESEMQPLMRQLSRAGFRRVFCSRPRTASASTGR